jgi:hypothetical protein
MGVFEHFLESLNISVQDNKLLLAEQMQRDFKIRLTLYM